MRLAIALAAFLPAAFAQCVSLTNAGATYTEDFNSLASIGTSGTMPTGWSFAESGANANATYTAGDGASNSGDTYSFGQSGSDDRAIGGLLSGSLTTTIGACFVNNTGQTIARLTIAYTGEQWRLGALGRRDQLQFQYSTNASSLATGAWTSVTALDFAAPSTGPTVGPVFAATALRATLQDLNLAGGAVFWIRWLDFNAAGADDGLAVDDFSLTPEALSGLSVNDLSVSEGDTGTHLAEVQVTLAAPAPAGGVTFDIQTADGSATAGVDYTARALTGQTIPEGETTYWFAVTILGDTTYEPDETFTVSVTNIAGAAINRGTATVTIANDDTVTISAIQGAGGESPLAGQNVATTGIVTALKNNGFFLQGADDGNPVTSDGIFVFTGSPVPAAAVPGNLLRVSGTVVEFRPAADPNSPPLTEITSPAIAVLATGQTLPEPVPLTARQSHEHLEGMRVRVDLLHVVAPTAGTVNEANAGANSNGVFYGALDGAPRPFREPGVEQPDPLPPNSPCCVPRFDGNPERIRVDSDAQPGAAALNVATGASVRNLVGPLDYGFRTYTILPDPTSPPSVTGGAVATAVPVPQPDQFTVASFNMQRFFDTVNDPGVSDVALTAAAFAGRLNKASLAIRNLLRTPDILAVQEVENLATLETIAAKINGDAAAAGDPNPHYAAYLREGNDPGGIDVGFLVKTARVTVTGIEQAGAAATYPDPVTGQPAILNDRPPLVLRATVQPPAGVPFPITVIANHLRSLNDIADPATGGRVRAKRAAQAEFLARLIQQRQLSDPAEAIVVVGDFNAFQFNDGYADLIGTVRGAPAGPHTVVRSSPALVDPPLADAAAGVRSSQRYSYVFDGNAQTLDHILITRNLLPRLAALAYLRGNADSPETLRGDFNRPERLSDHDAPVAYFQFPRDADTSVSLTAAPAPVAGSDVTYSIIVHNGRNDLAANVQVAFPTPAQTALVSFETPGWECLAPPPGGAATVTCAKSSMGPRTTDTLQVTVNAGCALANGAPLTATATLRTQSFDADPANNVHTIETAVANAPPSISAPVVSAAPDGEFLDVNLAYTARDECGAAHCALSVSTSDPAGTRDDWQIVSANRVRLRAAAQDRVYILSITCRDEAGNTTTRTVPVTVPKP